MDPTPAQLRNFLRRLRAAIDAHRVFVSAYAAERAADELGWGQWDIFEQLKELNADDYHRREVSHGPLADVIWVFTPEGWDEETLWIRLIERDGVLVVSFHKA